MKKIGIIAAAGLGDALTLLIAAHRYHLASYAVTLFSTPLASFSLWLPSILLKNHPSSVDELLEFDTLLLQYDNTQRSKEIFSLRKRGKDLLLFYNRYTSGKHPPLLLGNDFPFDETKPMADNVAISIQSLLHLPAPSKETGLTPPQGLVFKKYPNRVVLHPTSSSQEKNWKPKRFLSLARKLFFLHKHPVFALHPEERVNWLFLQDHGFSIPVLPTVSDLAALIYESGYFIGGDSGPGHLASLLGLPQLTIASGEKNLQHWQPGWRKSYLITPPSWIPKRLKIRRRHWQSFISAKRVVKTFAKIMNATLE